MTLEQLLDSLRQNQEFMANVTAWRTQERSEARFAPFPPSMDPRILPALEKHGIHQLYTHQADALQAVSEGKDIVIVTPTAWRKSRARWLSRAKPQSAAISVIDRLVVERSRLTRSIRSRRTVSRTVAPSLARKRLSR